ncbi:MAG: DMT family transporter [Spirochaetes bacterium]|nr:DMT family transporter [Spirochaetota bacterium]
MVLSGLKSSESNKKINSRGIILLFISAFIFSFMTVFVKKVTFSSSLPAVEILFFRFLLGFVIISVILIATRQNIKPVKPGYVILRAVLNLFGALFLYMGIKNTAISNANMLHMTYPVFVYLFAPFLNKEKNSMQYYLFLLITMAGVFLIFSPDMNGVNKGDLYAFISAIISGAAISSLRETRKFENSFVILFYLMGIGSVISFLIMSPVFVMPEGDTVFYLIMAASLGVLGQMVITYGYRYINAAPGAIVSTSRIFIVFILGVIIFDDVITLRIIIGTCLIVFSLTGISGLFPKLKKMKKFNFGNE